MIAFIWLFWCNPSYSHRPLDQFRHHAELRRPLLPHLRRVRASLPALYSCFSLRRTIRGNKIHAQHGRTELIHTHDSREDGAQVSSHTTYGDTCALVHRTVTDTGTRLCLSISIYLRRSCLRVLPWCPTCHYVRCSIAVAGPHQPTSWVLSFSSSLSVVGLLHSRFGCLYLRRQLQLGTLLVLLLT